MHTPTRLQRLNAAAVAATAFVSGALLLGIPLLYRLPFRLYEGLPTLHPLIVHRALATILGFALMYISYQLAQRKRVAWWIALLISLYVIGLGLFYHVPPMLPVLALAMLVCLALGRPSFTVRSRSISIRHGILLLAASLGLAILYGVAGFELLDTRDFGVDFSLGEAVLRTIREFIFIGDADLVAHTRYAKGFLESLDLIGLTGAAFGLFSLFRPLAHTLRVAPQERAQMRRLLEQYGDTSEGYLKLWPHDKSYFFTRDGAGGLAYAVRNGIAIVMGSPAGSPQGRIAARQEFYSYCATNDWDVVYVLVHENSAQEFKGWRKLKIGEDAIIDLGTFAETTVRNKHFRNIANRFRKQGYTFETWQPPHSGERVRELAAINSAWLQSGKTQWAFLQGRFDPNYMATGALYVLRDESLRAVAFANAVISYVPQQTTIDMMRYLPNAPTNTMDFLLMNIALTAYRSGYETFSLGIAPLAESDASNNPSPEERIIQLTGQLNLNFVSVGGLRQFKNKFEPTWEDQYVLYKGLPIILLRGAIALSRLTKL